MSNINLNKTSNVFENVAPIVKRQMTLFLVIDTSGSMHGTKIGTVNTAIREALPEIRKAGGAAANIKIAAMLFSNGYKWMHPEPILADDFFWESIEANGMTDMGVAFKELAKKMSKSSFLKSPSSAVAPAIFLMSDGQPTDNYKEGLDRLQENKWFQHAIKVAVAIGNDADIAVLQEFTGSAEGVIRTHTPEALSKMIRFISVTSSKIGSRSQGFLKGGKVRSKQDTMLQDIKDYLKENEDIDQDAPDQWD